MVEHWMDWASLLLRWLHVITAIAWIGSSFYFIWLDLSLRKATRLPDGVHGESWSVHGGGFYHVQKYMVAPDSMPKNSTGLNTRVISPGSVVLHCWQSPITGAQRRF